MPPLHDDLDVELLEPLLRQLIDLVGFQDTMVLVEAFGGTRLSVGERNPQLVRMIGADQAAKLARALAQDRIDRILVPKATKAMLAARNRRILADLQTRSVCETARLWRLSERMVYYIQVRADAPAEDRNLQLFG